MRTHRLLSVLLGLALTVPTVTLLAAPVEQSGQPDQPYSWMTGWQVVPNASWDGSRQWYGRELQVQPVAGLPGSIDVRVVVPSGVVPNFTASSFVPLVRQDVLPAVSQVFPWLTFQQYPLRVIQVQPDTFVLSHPGLFWGRDNVDDAYIYAAYLARINPDFVPWVFDGPRGYGAYLAYRLPPSS
jgi:hypothetical protein